MSQQTLDGITYEYLLPESIEEQVIKVCEEEWDPEDFPKYGDDLYHSVWRLEEVDVEKITPNIDLLRTDDFQKDLQPRIKKQKELFAGKIVIPPLILRGNDLFIFDGYARYHFFKDIGIKRCLAYVSHRK